MKRWIYLILILLATFPVISSITGEVSESPTNVAVFVQQGPPILYIYSPENTTYQGTDFLLNYSIRNDLNQSWYNLDNGLNISLGNLTGNSLSFTTNLGNHALNLYANNSLGESSRKVFFTVSEQSSQPPPGNGGGGGGGGSSITAFDLEKNLLQVSLIQGETKTEKIKVKNVGNTRITISITKDSLEDFALIENQSITINPGETKELEVHFFGLDSKLPNVYFGRIIFQSGTFRESVVTVIELKQRQALFDINVQILPNYKTVPLGKRISSIIDLTNIGLRGTAVDVSLSLYLTDDGKNKVSEISEEVLAVKDNLTIIRKILVPENLKDGTYFLIADLIYNNISATSYDSFNVELQRASSLWWIILLIVLIFVLSIIIIKVIYHHEKKIEKKTKKKSKILYKPFVKDED